MRIALCAVYVQRLETTQGIKNLSADKAVELAGTDPDYAVRDLYTAIGNKDFPSWTAYIQVSASSCSVPQISLLLLLVSSNSNSYVFTVVVCEQSSFNATLACTVIPIVSTHGTASVCNTFM
jgi:Catalase